MPEDIPFTEIVREMASTGFSPAEIIQNLTDMGLDRKTAEKLLGVTEKKASKIAMIKVEALVREKLGKRKQAAARKALRRKLSAERRRRSVMRKIQQGVDVALASDVTKRSIINSILSDYEELLERRKDIKRELARVLLEALDEKLPRRYETKLKVALSEVEEL